MSRDIKCPNCERKTIAKEHDDKTYIWCKECKHEVILPFTTLNDFEKMYIKGLFDLKLNKSQENICNGCGEYKIAYDVLGGYLICEDCRNNILNEFLNELRPKNIFYK